MKKSIITLLVLVSTLTLNANDLRSIAVINLTKIYTRYIEDSVEARQLSEYKKSIEDEISKRKIEIDKIQKDLIYATDDDNEILMAELSSQLEIKRLNLQSYAYLKNREYEMMISSSISKGDFLEVLKETIQEVGLENDIAVFLKSSDTNILWNSWDVDATDLVIEKLLTNNS